MELKYCIMDLEDLVHGMNERLKRNVEDVRKRGPNLTKVEEARFEVGHGLLMDTVDDLVQVLSHWKDNAPARRSTEIAMRKARESGGSEALHHGPEGPRGEPEDEVERR